MAILQSDVPSNEKVKALSHVPSVAKVKDDGTCSMGEGRCAFCPSIFGRDAKSREMFDQDQIFNMFCQHVRWIIGARDLYQLEISAFDSILHP